MNNDTAHDGDKNITIFTVTIQLYTITPKIITDSIDNIFNAITVTVIIILLQLQ